MKQGIYKSRYGCNLQGALQTLLHISGIVPVLHSTPGCGLQSYISKETGVNGNTYIQDYEIPSSNVYEKQVIFGGTSRLREQIKNTVKVMKADLYVTLSGCESEMVGDDSTSMTQEIVNQGVSAVNYKAPGFKGNQFIGYQGIMYTLITELLKVSEEYKTDEIYVNILGIIPQQDLYWQGNLNQIEKILNEFNIGVNKLFGYKQDINNIKKLSGAALNIVVSKWGVEAANTLQDLYHIPSLSIEYLGLGFEFVEELVKKVLEVVNKGKVLNQSSQSKYLEESKSKFYYGLQHIIEYYHKYEFQKNIVIVGEESTVIRYGEFLKNYLGMQVEAVIITDYEGEANKQESNNRLRQITSNVYYSRDTYEIAQIILNTDVELILGSSLEKGVATQAKVPLYEVSYPVFDKVIIDQSDIGVNGAIRVIEELSSLIIANSYE